MGFLSSILGTENDYQAHAPVNKFQANNPAAPGSAAMNGAGPAAGTIGQMNGLSASLTAAANGQGPSPAQEMLRQATSQNINTAASTAASARGINPALAARMAVDSSGQANQQAAGQAATLKANEQIAARGQLGQNLAQTGQIQVGQLGTVGNLDLGAQRLDQTTQAQNASLDLGAQQINAGVASQNAATSAGLVGGVLNGAGAAMAASKGGEIPTPGTANYAENQQREVPRYTQLVRHLPPSAHPPVYDPSPIQDATRGVSNGPVTMRAAGGAIPGGSSPLHSYLDSLEAPVAAADGGEIPAPPPPPDDEPTPAAPTKSKSNPTASIGSGVTQAGAAGLAAYDRATARPVMGSMYATGGSIHQDPSGMVPGRAAVQGDARQNDTVHTLLSPGEIVIPRSITMGPNAPAKAASFVASILKRGGGASKLSMGGMVPSYPPAGSSRASAEAPGAREKFDNPRLGRGNARAETRRRIKAGKSAAGNE